MREILLSFLKKVFDIREGEVQRAFLMQLNIFLIISTLLIVKPTVNGLFLSEIGVEKLPVTFVLVALFAVIFSTLYTRLLGRISLNKIILATLFISALLFILFGILLRLNIVGGWLLYAFYIWVAIFGVLSASQFWIIANVVFNAREAKRLFGFIGSGAIAGGIFGGYLTTLLAERMGSENLLFIGAGMLSLCIPITAYIWKKNVLTTQSKFQRRKKIARTDHPFVLIRQSKHLTYLAAIIGISVIVAKLVDFQFSAIASDKIDDPDELTAFFGFWFSNFNVISLIVQLVLTRRIVGTLGIGSSLFFLPGAILLGAVFVFFFPELWAAIFIKMADGSLKQSVNKASVELLALPIPSEIKNQTKTFIDVVVDSIATGISGVILIFVVNGLDLSYQFISLITGMLILMWIFFVFRIRQTYINAFKINLKKVHQNGDGKLDLENASVLGDLKKVLSTGSDQQVIYVLRKLRIQPDSRMADSITNLLSHPSDQIKEEAIRVLYFFNNQNFTSQIQPLTTYPAQKVKIAAFDYLIAHSPDQMFELMNSYLNDGDYRVWLAALVSLAEESRDNPVLKETFELEKRLQNVYDQIQEITIPKQKEFFKIGLVKAIGLAKIPSFFPVIEEFSKDERIAVARQAILAAGTTMHPYFIPILIQNLAQPDLSDSTKTALETYGREIIHPLSEYIHSSHARPVILREIPQIAERFGSQESVDLLIHLLTYPGPRVRLAALRSLNKLKINHDYLNFRDQGVIQHILTEAHLYQDTLSILYVQMNAIQHHHSQTETKDINHKRQSLIGLLETKLDANLERIFRLLGLKYPPEDIITIYENIKSKQPEIRVNALEYLDNLLDLGLKKILMPIVETTLLESITEKAIQDLNLKLPSEAECLEMLLSSEDELVRNAVKDLRKSLNYN